MQYLLKFFREGEHLSLPGLTQDLINVMKPLSLQQEILLVTTSNVSHRQLAGDDSSDLNRHLSHTERLEEACWHGLLEDILPGTIERPSSGKKLHLWQIRSGSRFLHIELCTFPVVIEKRHSLDPYLFVPTTCAN